ncbi:MAG: lysozyme [Chlamydiales bacterium]|nr:lysozyme [Chlamydiales bacterium]
MKTSEQGLALIKQFESLKLKAYICPAGKLTIGYGHTGSDVQTGMSITQIKAEELLQGDVRPVETFLNHNLTRLSQNQFDALVSLIFNIGIGNFKTSTLFKLAKINPDDAAIATQFARWNKGRANGVLQALPGLTKRRAIESKLYFKQ